MTGRTPPIDIATPKRFGSTSPRNQTSNLTSALHDAGTGARTAATADGRNRAGSEFRPENGRQGSFGNTVGTSQYGSEARPIAVMDKPRKDSMAASLMNGSLMNGGMSWGNTSMSSWIRDDVMTGTSPYSFHSPSFQSSSYLPKMEANFMRDFACCGETLNSLHELLQHYEQAHAQAPPNSPELLRSTQNGGHVGHQPPKPRMTSATFHKPVQPVSQQVGFAPGQVMQRDLDQTLQRAIQPIPGRNTGLSSIGNVQDMDALDDMEMDESSPPASQQQQALNQQMLDAAPIGRLSALNLGVANAMQPHRSSTPNTPSTVQGFSLQNNPTVSSVNTPALSAHSVLQHNKSSPESSYPGTPAELEQDTTANAYSGSGLPLGSQYLPNGGEWSSFGFGLSNGNDMLELCIDEPAKRLFNKTGGFNHQQYPQFGQGNGPMNQPLESRMLGKGGGLSADVNKPHKCPVIGCEKAYKNNNGLKYHRQHGHQNQQLVENPDKTFSIVDPATSIPYPGTVGMEKEKPYRCQVCGKRYKNLNGLKYHKQHAPPCNPDLAKPTAASTAGPHNIPAMNANVAGAGVSGMGADSMMI